MGQARPMIIVGLADQYLCLVHQPAKRGAVDDSIAVALVDRAERVWRLWISTSVTVARMHRGTRQEVVLMFQPRRCMVRPGVHCWFASRSAEVGGRNCSPRVRLQPID